ETEHKVAWAACMNSYEKGDDDKWHKKKYSLTPLFRLPAPR
ncbi:ChaB family protein, partial [Klebsiella pneumoniae]